MPDKPPVDPTVAIQHAAMLNKTLGEKLEAMREEKDMAWDVVHETAGLADDAMETATIWQKEAGIYADLLKEVLQNRGLKKRLLDKIRSTLEAHGRDLSVIHNQEDCAPPCICTDFNNCNARGDYDLGTLGAIQSMQELERRGVVFKPGMDIVLDDGEVQMAARLICHHWGRPKDSGLLEFVEKLGKE
jgi:hypothetical protein